MSHAYEILPSRVPAPGGRSLLMPPGHSIALFNVGGTLYAIDDSCPHAGSSLASGKLDGLMLQCPAHGLKFSLATGCMAGGGMAVRRYPLRVADGKTWLDLSEESFEETNP